MHFLEEKFCIFIVYCEYFKENCLLQQDSTSSSSLLLILPCCVMFTECQGQTQGHGGRLQGSRMGAWSTGTALWKGEFWHTLQSGWQGSYLGSRESIMGARAEGSSPSWVCNPEITSDNEWFLWNTNSRGWTLFRSGAHDRLYFFHNDFPDDNFTKSQLSVEEIRIHYYTV